eukprot:GHRR01025139.1.p1 GENE.GHRR01025139.1~~GHRR01025139.1.p1  ORF type:complete len:359 (+),score=96.89 GHRR01025139.1:158-1234(+)
MEDCQSSPVPALHQQLNPVQVKVIYSQLPVTFTSYISVRNGNFQLPTRTLHAQMPHNGLCLKSMPKYVLQAVMQVLVSFSNHSDCFLQDELTKNRCRSRSIDVWQRGVDTDMFNPRHNNAAMRVRMTDGHPEDPLLVYVGRLGAEKNTEALKDILQQVPGARLALVGDGPQRQELEQVLAGMPVKFMGMMKGEELSQAYASADVFVMPSETETLGFVVLEAMASGVPVVAVAAGGLTDIITESGKSGLLYSPGDYAQAAQHVRNLLADPVFRAQLGAAGRKEVELFGWSAATRVLRQKQYARAVRLSIGKRRFWLLMLRVGITRMFRAFLGLIVALWSQLVRRMDYARDFRPPNASLA